MKKLVLTAFVGFAFLFTFNQIENEVRANSIDDEVEHCEVGE